jgi:hypothetical protein
MKVLTPQAEQDLAEFLSRDSCCSCHLNPPCSHCTDPGNPDNQAEDPTCWEEKPDDA